ncbi:MAG TPA: class I SAM-dependent methyltransferase [Geminicoccaceae bacterium]|nr:class I SAM-dependent methyltransferase [Geminicoccaceae bacterium]
MMIYNNALRRRRSKRPGAAEVALGFYQRRVMPRLIHFGMRQKQLVPLREQLCAGARGRVLEIGIGSGLNLPFYPREIEILLGLDPSRELLEMAKRQASWVHFPVELGTGYAEDIPLEDHSVDHVVLSWTLCSVADPGRALAEIRRVLRPEGGLLFVEHGRAPQPRVARWQDRLTPVWRRLAGGCHLNRPIDELLERAGLRLVEIERGHLVSGPRVATYHYRGRAAA